MDRRRSGGAGSSRARRGRPAAARRARTGACPSRRRRGAGPWRAARAEALTTVHAGQAYRSAPRAIRGGGLSASEPSASSRTWAAAAGRCTSTTSDARRRRRPDRDEVAPPERRQRCSPSASVDSQIGPWTSTTGVVRARAGQVGRRGRRPRRATSARRSCGRRTGPAGSARSCPRRGRPGAPRARTWSTRADEPAGPGHEARPGSIARRRGAAGRDRVEERRHLPREARRVRRRLAERRDREAAADVERVEIVELALGPARRGQRPPDAVPPASTAPSCEPDVEVDATQARAPAPPRRPRPPRSARSRSGRTCSRHARRRGRRGSPAPRRGSAGAGRRRGERRRARAGKPGEHLGQLVDRLDRDPQERPPVAGRPDCRPQVRVGLADALERDPLVRQAGRRRRRPLAARHDVRSRSGVAARRRRSPPGRRSP